MKTFTPILKHINEKLDLPQPTKSRIILEISSDLEDLYEVYIQKGLNENEAKLRADEKLNLTDEALIELEKIHQSFFRRFMNKLNEQGQTRWKRIVLAIVLLFLITISTRTVLTTPFILQASIFIFPILGLFLVIIILSLVKFYKFYIKKEHVIKKLRTGLPAILILGGINLFIGIFGYIVELFLSIRTTLYSGYLTVIITVLNNRDGAFFSAVERVLKCSSMAMVCTFVTIFTALVCYILNNKIIKIEQAEAASLLKD